MRVLCAILLLATIGSNQTLAGDVAKGEKIFKKCKACHVVNFSLPFLCEKMLHFIGLNYEK